MMAANIIISLVSFDKLKQFLTPYPKLNNKNW